MNKETAADVLREYVKQAQDGEIQWDTLCAIVLEAANEIERLESQLDRTRMDNISMAYNLAGPGR